MLKTIKLLIFLIFLTNIVQALEISEIMYNPEGNDNNQEYLEIIDENIINLTNYKLEDLKEIENLTLIQNLNTTIALIVEEDFNLTNINVTVYTTGKTIGNNLNNDYDLIILRDQDNNIVDGLNYYEEWGGNDNGKTLCILKSQTPLRECIATPGKPNQEENIFYDYTPIKINEFMPNPVGYDNAPMPDGEWIELYNQGDEEIDTEGLTLEDLGGRSITISQEKVETTTIIKPKNYLTIYANGFSGLLNNEGLETLALKYNENIIDHISYSYTSEGVSWNKKDNFWIQAKPTKGTKNIFDNTSLETNLKIKELYLGSDEKTKFGQDIRVKVEITKGDTEKYNVEAYILKDNEKIGKTSKISVYSKFINYSLVIPVHIPDNCKEKLQNGTYTLIVEGLEKTAEEQFQIEGIDKDSCKEIEKECKKTTCKETITYQNQENFETNINQEEIPLTALTIYEATSKKTTDIGKYLLICLLILIIITKIKWLSKSKQ